MIHRTRAQVVRAYRGGASNAVAAGRLKCCTRKAGELRRRERIPAAKPWTSSPSPSAPPKAPRRQRPLKRTPEQLDAVFSLEGDGGRKPGPVPALTASAEDYVSPAAIRELLGGVTRTRVAQLRAQWRDWKDLLVCPECGWTGEPDDRDVHDDGEDHPPNIACPNCGYWWE